MTNGGPGYSSSVLALYAYKISFAENNLGYGNTVSVAVMVVMVIIIAGAKGIMSLFKSKE